MLNSEQEVKWMLSPVHTSCEWERGVMMSNSHQIHIAFAFAGSMNRASNCVILILVTWSCKNNSVPVNILSYKPCGHVDFLRPPYSSPVVPAGSLVIATSYKAKKSEIYKCNSCIKPQLTHLSEIANSVHPKHKKSFTTSLFIYLVCGNTIMCIYLPGRLCSFENLSCFISTTTEYIFGIQ